MYANPHQALPQGMNWLTIKFFPLWRTLLKLNLCQILTSGSRSGVWIYSQKLNWLEPNCSTITGATKVTKNKKQKINSRYIVIYQPFRLPIKIDGNKIGTIGYKNQAVSSIKKESRSTTDRKQNNITGLAARRLFISRESVINTAR